MKRKNGEGLLGKEPWGFRDWKLTVDAEMLFIKKGVRKPKAQFICAYFINTNMDITTVIAEKRKRTSPCEPQFNGHSPTLHTQCTPLSNITSSVNQCQQHYTGQFQI